MKIIDIDKDTFRSLIPAPIDEKNICSDSLIDTIYDDFGYTENGNQSVGFVNDIATLITYGDAMIVDFIHPFSVVVSRECLVTKWRQAIVGRLTGITIPPDKESIYILDEDNDLIYGVFCDKDSIAITFKYNQKYE